MLDQSGDQWPFVLYDLEFLVNYHLLNIQVEILGLEKIDIINPEGQ